MDLVYPKHIYDPIRREVAVSYIQHELRKYLPNLKDENGWKVIDADIEKWFDQSPLLFPVRDFWNGFHGILMGFKLKNQLLSYITGENVVWEKQEIELSKLTLGSGFEFFSEAGITSSEVAEIMAVYQKNDQIRLRHLELVVGYYQVTKPRENDPIIVTQKRFDDEDKQIVYDGNGRTVLAILQGKDKIFAYVSRFIDERGSPENYWLPTSVLMEIVHFAKISYNNRDSDLYDSYITVIKNMLRFSQSGTYEMRERVIPSKSDFRDKLFEDLRL